MLSLEQIRDIIVKKDNFILMGHLNPDGDCIGSLFAMKWYLDTLDKQSIILLETPPTSKYELFGIDSSEYTTFNEFAPTSDDEYICIALDSGDLDRLGSGKALAEQYYTVNIDHHVDNPEYGDINYINSKKSAVGHILYDLINLDLKFSINKKIGTAIATAIIADTGGLRYQNATAEVFNIISDLMELDVDIYSINRAIFAGYQYTAVKLKGMALSTLQVHENGKIAYLRVEQKMLDEIGADLEDASGLVNYARDIQGIELGIVFTEVTEEETRIGFRSNNYCSVNEIAALFGGGGHPRAAGCTINENINKAEKMILSKVKNYV